MRKSQPDTPKQNTVPATTLPSWRARLTSAIPFLVTALASVLLTLTILAFVPLNQNTAQTPPPATASPSPSPSETESVILSSTPTLTPTTPPAPERQPTMETVETMTPVPSPLPPDIATLQQELDTLNTEMESLWSAYYLARAASQLADAEDALRSNNITEANQILLTVGVSLELAYRRSPEQDKGPINEFRMQVATIHENLSVRPENLDLRLRRLRQSMLTLIDRRN